MSKKETIGYINSQIEKINKVIDQKIIAGKPYKKEAAQHKALLQMLLKAEQ